MGFWDALKRLLTGDPAPAPPAATSPSSAPVARPATPYRDPHVAPGILGLSAAEHRRRALRINPYNTPWIGRVDTIPPQSDERTALIDRGLILRGLLSEAQIEDIHRVGDQWLKFYEAERLAAAVAHRKASEAIAAAKAARDALKEQKRREAASRREARKNEIAHRKATDIVFAGRGVSAKLFDRKSNIAVLEAAGLPVLSTPNDLARALDIGVPKLRWLVHHHESPERTHYVYFEIPKRSGGMRMLAAPKNHLRRAQSWVLEQILGKIPVTEHAQGFVSGRSTVSNAAPHLGSQLIINLDLADFFPTIAFVRVRGLFESFGYSPAVSTLLALICTESSRAAVDYAGRRFWVAVTDRALPQGACTSPAISNLVTRKLDRRLAGACRALGFTYTRYADDLTFSAKSKSANASLLLARVRHIVREEGFVINDKKGRLQRRGRRQEVTGIVVNDKLAIARSEVRKLRAILHNAKKTGLSAQNRDHHPHFEAWLRGKIGYVMMVDPARGKTLAEALAVCRP